MYYFKCKFSTQDTHHWFPLKRNLTSGLYNQRTQYYVTNVKCASKHPQLFKAVLRNYFVTLCLMSNHHTSQSRKRMKAFGQQFFQKTLLGQTRGTQRGKVSKTDTSLWIILNVMSRTLIAEVHLVLWQVVEGFASKHSEG